MMKKASLVKKSSVPSGYTSVLADIAHLLESARHVSVRTTNAIMERHRVKSILLDFCLNFC